MIPGLGSTTDRRLSTVVAARGTCIFPACIPVGLGGGGGGGSAGEVGALTVVFALKAEASCSVSCLARKGRRPDNLSVSGTASSTFRPLPLLLVLLRDKGIGLTSSDCFLRAPNAFLSLKPLDVFAGVLEVEESGEGAGAAGWGRVYVCPMTPSEDERGAGDTATDGKCVFVVVDSCDAAD